MFEELLRDPATALLLLSGATTGIVEVIKKANFIGKKYLPLTSIFVGIFLSWCVAEFVFSASVLLLGIVFGLAGSGFFENIKKLIETLSK